jgi:aminoglycoside 3-N-acetyltransferase
MEKVIKQLTDEWEMSGVRKNDTLLIHSSLSRLLRKFRQQGIHLKPIDVLTSFQYAVGNKGTLLLPLFNWEFFKIPPSKELFFFDIRTTPSQMGVLTEVARCHLAAIRTPHPTHSFAILGYNAEAFKDLTNFTSCGADSPFAVLKMLNGKIAVLDLPENDSMTFYHHVEEMEQVDYREHKTFKVNYANFDGVVNERIFKLSFSNKKKGVFIEVTPMGERLWELGLYTGNRPGVRSGLRVVSANDLYQVTADVIRSGQALGMLYRVEKIDLSGNKDENPWNAWLG